jgi:hypothetical protein
LRSVFKEKWKHHPLLKQCLFWAFFFKYNRWAIVLPGPSFLSLLFYTQGRHSPWVISLSLSLSHTHTE